MEKKVRQPNQLDTHRFNSRQIWQADLMSLEEMERFHEWLDRAIRWKKQRKGAGR